MKKNQTASLKEKLKILFGIGPTGAVVSVLLLAAFAGMDALWEFPLAADHGGILKILGLALMGSGLGLHFWSMSTLHNWWVEGRLCTKGPFAYFRHPMYAAWISFICPGMALYLNSWFYLFWIVLLHPIWHRLVSREEDTMAAVFGDDYRDYARRTGRFFPKIL